MAHPDHMKEFTIQDNSSIPQVAEPPTVMSTLGMVSAPTAAAATVNEDEDEDENVPLAFLVHHTANPRIATNQRQKRLQPRSAAPTSKVYKAAAKRGERLQNESRKVADNRAQGKTKGGNNAY